MIGPGSSAVVSWVGGRSTLTFSAILQYGATVTPQMLTGNGKWIAICSNIVSDQIFVFDAPPGRYCVVNTGSSIGMFASITASY